MYEVVKSATQKRQLSEKSESPLLNRAHSSYSAARLKRSIIHRQYGETKAQFLWRLLRLFVHKRLDSVTHDELEDMAITHGITKLKHLIIGSRVKSLCFNLDDKHIVSLDYDNYVNIYRTDGRFISSQYSYDNTQDQSNKFTNFIQPVKPYDHIVYCSKNKQYIGWTKGEIEINVFTKQFDLLSTSKSLEPLECLAYEKNTGDVITCASNGDIVIWNFRYKAKYLVPKTTHRSCLETKFTHNIMIVEPVETTSTLIRCFIATTLNVVVLNAYDGKILSTKENLHIRSITAMTLFLPMKYLITASKEGSIKVWDMNWSLKIVFVGHNECVLSLAIHPFAPYVISSSNDKTLRIWSLDQQDIVDKIELEEPIELINTENAYVKFLTSSGDCISLWKVNHLYEMFTNIGRKINSIKSIVSMDTPTRTLAQCETGGFHIICPANGHVLTSYLTDEKSKLIDTIYSTSENLAIICFDDGKLAKVDTQTNPCMTVLINSNFPKKVRKLLLYEYVAENIVTDANTINVNHGDDDDEHRDFTRQSRVYQTLKTKSAHDLVNIKLKSFDRTLIFAGCLDGSICVVRWDNLDLDYEIEMHNNREISQLVANVKDNQLLSAGLDLVIKVWRVYPYVVECLQLMRTIFMPYQPQFFGFLKERICVAFNDIQTFAYSIKFFNVETNDKYEHTSVLDHTEPIIALSVCEKLKIVGSASMDCTIRLWNLNCDLLRCINLKEKPTSMSFVSQRADVFIGFGNNLFKMDHTAYLPRLVLFKMITLEFDGAKKEDPIPYDQKLKNQLTKANMQRLQSAHKNLLRFASAQVNRPIRPDDDWDRDLYDEETINRNKGIAVLAERDLELRKLCRGEIKPIRHRMKKKTVEEGFNNYMNLYYDKNRRVRILEPDVFDLNGDMFQDYQTQDVYHKEALNGFFPSVDDAHSIKPYNTLVDDHKKSIRTSTKYLYGQDSISANQSENGDFDDHQQQELQADQSFDKHSTKHNTSLAVSIPAVKKPDEVQPSQLKAPYFISGGFIPNSILIRIIWGPETFEQNQNFDEFQLFNQIPVGEDIEDEKEEYKYDEGEEFFVEKNVLGMVDDIMNKRVKSQTKRTPTPKLPTPVPSAQPRAVTFEEKVKRTKGMKQDMEDEILNKQLQSRLAKEAREAEEARRKAAELRALEEARIREEEERERERLEKERKEAERLAKQKPPVIQIGVVETTWFKRNYTLEETKTLPISIQQFAVEVIKKAANTLQYEDEYIEETTYMLQMLQTCLNEDKEFKTKKLEKKTTEPIINNIVKLLRKINLNPKNPRHLDFLLVSFGLGADIGEPTRNMVIEWMYWFISGTERIRRTVRALFRNAGISELHLFFYEELDSWETWKIDDNSDKQNEIVKQCTKWLHQYQFAFESHLKDTLKSIHSGQTEARISDKSKDMLKNSQTQSAKTNGNLSVKLQKNHDKHIGHISPIEVINYFCEVMHENEKLKIEKMKIEKEEKNTVLILPIIHRNTVLIRLGESHTNARKPKKEEECVLPPIKVNSKHKYGDLISTTHINFPLKHVNLHPFDIYKTDITNSELYDDNHEPSYTYVNPEFDLLTLKTSQKYFVLKNSYSIK